MSDIAEIEAHLVRAQAAYDKLPLSGPVTSWCELYGEDLLDSCTKLLAALKQRTELIDAAAGHWLESCRTTSPPIAWEGAIDGAMEAVCKEVERLRARVAELEDYSGISWDGFNLRGDAKSIGEVRRLMSRSDRLDQLEPYLRGLLKEAKQRIAELEAAQEWRPIESAPRDGTRVFLWLPEITDYQRPRRIESFWMCGYWANKYGNGPAYNVNARPDKKFGGALAAQWEEIKPTHWMPLPAPPEAKP